MQNTSNSRPVISQLRPPPYGAYKKYILNYQTCDSRTYENKWVINSITHYRNLQHQFITYIKQPKDIKTKQKNKAITTRATIIMIIMRRKTITTVATKTTKILTTTMIIPIAKGNKTRTFDNSVWLPPALLCR